MLTEFLRSFTLPGLEKKYIVADESLTEEGAAADSKKVGQELAKKVDKETGKALSTNDYTNAEKTKLAGVDSGAQVNTIEGVKVDGTEVTPDAQKKVNLNVYDKSAINAIVQEIYAEVAKKLNIDGYSELATVGNALGLVTDSVVEDKEPYNFRSLAHLPVGKFCYDTIVGGSVVWNQLNDTNTATATVNGITWTKVQNNIWTASGTATADSTFRVGYWMAKSGHIYFVKGCPSGGSTSTYYVENDIGGGRIYKREGVDTGIALTATIKSGVTVSNLKFSQIIIDLTALLTPEPADYIYSLEQANAGAGVAYFKKYFPEEYYEYCEPRFEHVQTSGKVTIGFNQWDEEWVNGTYNAQGVIASSNRYMCSKNLIPVLPSTQYYLKSPDVYFEILSYDENKNYLRRIASSAKNRVVTMNDKTHYIAFGSATADAYTRYTPGDICINIHGDRDGEYEPYKKRTYPLDSSLTLRGIPKLDASNRLYFDGDVYQHDGTVTRRYGVYTYDGSESWLTYDYNGKKSFRLPNNAVKTNSGNCITDKDFEYSRYAWAATTTKLVTPYSGYLYFRDPSIETLADWKASLQANPVTVVCELKEPTIETAEPFQSPMVVDPLGTEEFIDYGVEEGDRDVKIPCGHTSEYPEDLVDKLEVLPHATGTNGDYLITEINGKLYLKPYTQTVGLTSVSETEAEL